MKVYLPRSIYLGFSDLIKGLRAWRLWHLLGTGELRRRYARSRLGQFWLTISTGISILIMAFVWAVLFKTPIAQMLPYIAISIILWQYIASIVSDATSLFTASGHLMLNQRIEGSVIVFAAVYRNILILLHNLVLIPIIFIAFWVPVTERILLFIPALVLIAITSVWVSYIIGILCARFRDLSNIIASIMQLAFYVTPVIWKPGFMGESYQWLLLVNPFTYFLGILRAPILGEASIPFNWIMAIVITFGGLFLSTIIIGKSRQHLMYWI